MTVTIHTGDVLSGLAKIESGTVQTCVTSPPYWGLRDYGVDGQIGLESSPDEYVARMVDVFREVRRTLRDDGTLFLNLGDSYAAAPAGNFGPNMAAPADGGTYRANKPAMNYKGVGLKPKDLCMIPWRVALALQADGWWLRSVIVWAKKSPMPESVTDRPTSSWEPIFLLAKNSSYFYDAEAVRETGVGRETFGNWIKGDPCPDRNDNSRQNMHPTATRNQRNVWHLGPEPYAEAHFATFPTEIPRRCIMAGTSEKGCCPECGACWKRLVEKIPNNDGYANGPGGRNKEYEHHSGTLASVARWNTATNGWQPTCDCWTGDNQEELKPHDPVPCLVLDPFLGSGTTLAVASQLGRRGVGCELNPEYVKLAQDRIGRATRPNTYQSDKAVDAPLFTQGATAC